MPRFATLALGCLACLSGCSTAPQQIVASAPAQNFLSSFRPYALATCTASNARNFSDKFNGTVEELIRPDNYQVVVRNNTRWKADPIIVAYTSPAPDGSQLQMFLSNELAPATVEDWIARLRKGCGTDGQATIMVPVVPRDALPVVNPPPPAVPALPLPSGRQPRG